MALKTLGFREARARRAIAEVTKLYRDAPTVEQALREAIIAATAA
jgi:Holliday junction resolvasome RuvABC DNA-binding subunit